MCKMRIRDFEFINEEFNNGILENISMMKSMDYHSYLLLFWTELKANEDVH